MKLMTGHIITFLTVCLASSEVIQAKITNGKLHWEDQIVPNAYVVSNTKPSGPGSLQRAVEKARLNTDLPTEISFNIPKSDPGYNRDTGTYIIQLEKTLEIPSDTLIDGFTQNGSSANTQKLENPDNAVITIEIQPHTPTARRLIRPFGDTIVFPKGSTGSRLKGVIVHGSRCMIPATEEKEAYYPAAIRIAGNEHVIEGCFVGVDAKGERSDATITALVVEGNNNVIGEERNNFTFGQSAIRPSTRMIIGGLGATLAYQDIPAVLFSGHGNKIVNGQLGICRSGSKTLDHIAATGLQVIINSSTIPADRGDSDLIIDTFAAAGSKKSIFNLLNFNAIEVKNVSAGTNPSRTIGLGGGIGLSASTYFAPVSDLDIHTDSRGTLTITDSLFSGLTTGIHLGTQQDDLLGRSHLNEVTVHNSYLGTDGLGTTAIPNIYGATTHGIRTLKVTDSTISGNLMVGWQHETSCAENIALFDSNNIGISTSPSQKHLPNEVGISIVGKGTVTLQNNHIASNNYGVIASRDSQLSVRANNIMHNVKANTIYKAWHAIRS